MMKKILLLVSLIMLALFQNSYAYLKIDTNDLKLKASVTNIQSISIPEPMVPSSYLKTGKIEFQTPETELRRFDVIYFIAVPITFYLGLNLIFILNSSFIAQNDTGLPAGIYPVNDTVQFRYILLNTLLIPLFVAWEDLQYTRAHAPATTTPPLSSGVNLGLNLVHFSF